MSTKRIKKAYKNTSVKRMLKSKKLVGSIGDPLAAAGQEATSYGVNAATMFAPKILKKKSEVKI